jgi:uncharacterized protein YndB with AHSA1/START domain
MSEPTVTHATFVLERDYEASPSRVFAAWADPALKARWFLGAEDGESPGYELDFRVGGRETARGGPEGGPTYSYEAHYQDIVPDRRIVATYEMYLDDARISVSVTTVELRPEGDGTRVLLTEQGAYLDGLDEPAQRERGTATQLDALGAVLEREPAGA